MRMLSLPRLGKRLSEGVRILRQAASFYRTSFYRVGRRWLSIRSRKFGLAEAFHCGLLDPGIAPDELDRYTSKGAMMAAQAILNPTAWRALLDNKALFYRYGAAVGIPVPTLHAVFMNGQAGWASSGQQLASREDWVAFLSNDLPDEFAIKPAGGVYGKGFMVYRANCSGFIDAFGKHHQAEDIYHGLHSDPNYGSFVIQERLANHEELARLSRARGLQTARVITLVDRQGVPQVVHACLKAVVGDNIIDNHCDGQTGNLVVDIDLSTGRLRDAVIGTRDGSGSKTIAAPPDTQIPFAGYQVPMWSKVCDLARAAALHVFPLRTVGWDIAITPKGLFIIEGNVWYDPPHCIPGASGLIGAALARELRWQKPFAQTASVMPLAAG